MSILLHHRARFAAVSSRASVIVPLLRVIWRRPSGAIGLCICAVHALLALLGGFIVPYDPLAQDPTAVLAAPSFAHPFGTDHLGRDVLSRTIVGGQTAMAVTGIAAILAVLWGGSVGILAAMRGGLADEAIMRLVDAVGALPYLLFLLLLAAFVGDSVVALIPALALFYGVAIVRVTRAAALSVYSTDFVQAAIVRGEPVGRVLRQEILPNVLDVILVDGALRWSWMILGFSALSFLGFGVAPPTPDWGLMIAETRHVLAIAPWAALWPCVALATFIVGFNLLIDTAGKLIGVDHEARGQR
ncbi:MAG: ABC transporter permease [Roseitalea sp.]|jgi:peptide/nickel transport system permease protein|nr:ABC transporter permease [Roseitalea sp.]MBO6721223.1 ABC transporter permease [Roseitalea sp.]MBO6744281.1 ABC transporter permease [Roseitalea sp.]